MVSGEPGLVQDDLQLLVQAGGLGGIGGLLRQMNFAVLVVSA